MHYSAVYDSSPRIRTFHGGSVSDGGRERSVLLLDDDPMTHVAVCRSATLQERPVAIHMERNAVAGLKRLRAMAAEGSPPDCIVCDLCMPGMSGEEMLEAIRADAALATIPFVLLTDYGDPAERTRISSRLGVDVLDKGLRIGGGPLKALDWALEAGRNVAV